MFRLMLARVLVLHLTALLSAVAAPFASAQETGAHLHPDTTASRAARSYALEEFLVTSSRIPSTVLRSPAPVSLIQRSDIERSGAASLGDILATAPGVFIKDYGTSSGIKTISQRGLGSEHTLVLLNGMPVNSVQSGSLDFGTIPAEEIERVEVIRGGQSASFGANAVAGVVNVVTRTTRGGNATARFSAGSFGEREMSASAGSGEEALRWRVSGGVQKAEGDYPFIFSNGPAIFHLTRNNAEYNARRVSGQLDLALSDALRLYATAFYLSSDRGVPGVVTSPFSSSRASQRDQQGILQLGAQQTLSLRTWWELKLQGLYAYQRYADPDLVVGGIPLDNSFRNAEERMELQFHTEPFGHARYTVGGDLVHAAAEGNTASGSPDRLQGGLFLVGEHSLPIAHDSTVLLSIHPALRYDRVGNSQDAFSPQVGIQALFFRIDDYGPLKHILRVHGTVGRNFRTPTFNELYYSGGGGLGNPHLRPERSTTYDLGAGVSLVALGEHELDLTWFEVDMQDRIVWTTSGTSTTTPKNLRDVVVRGIELTYTWLWPAAGTTASLSYSRSRSEKTSLDFPGDPNLHTEIPYVPQELFSGMLSWGEDLALGPLRRCDLSLSASRIGFRYTTEDNAAFLPSHTLYNAGVTLGLDCFGVYAGLRVDVRNLLEESYAVMPGYPMPLRSYKFTFSLSI
jgi:vitamin B12 transporter